MSAPSSTNQEPGLAEDWRAVLKTGALSLRLAMHFGETPSFDSLDQGITGLVMEVERAGRRLVARIEKVGTFEGEFSEDGAALAGALVIGPQRHQLVFERGTFAAADRPQNPVGPFPYRDMEVTYHVEARPGVRLAGTLTIPDGSGPFPAVLMITGSGRHDRDETIFEHKPFLVVADHLARRGIAVLRVDDPGAGGSTGAHPDATTQDFAADVRAGVAWLRARPEVDPYGIGLIGHSEGGLIAPLAAIGEPVAFVILWAASAIRGREIVVGQQRAINQAAGMPAEELESHVGRMHALLDAIMAAPDGETALTAVTRILDDAEIPAEEAAGIEMMAGAWYRNFVAYDPAPTLRALQIPVLALLGAKDLQVVLADNLPAFETALADNPKARIVVLPGLNHLFQTAETGGVDEYGRISETIAPDALQLMSDWILEVARPPA